MAADPDESQVFELAAVRMRELADSAIASGRPLSWCDALYKGAEAGTTEVPWDHRPPVRQQSSPAVSHPALNHPQARRQPVRCHRSR